MKLFIAVAFLIFLSSCATPPVKKGKMDRKVLSAKDINLKDTKKIKESFERWDRYEVVEKIENNSKYTMSLTVAATPMLENVYLAKETAELKEQAFKENWDQSKLKKKLNKAGEWLRKETCFSLKIYHRSHKYIGSDIIDKKTWHFELLDLNNNLVAKSGPGFLSGNRRGDFYDVIGRVCFKKYDISKGMKLSIDPRFRTKLKKIILEWN